MIATMALSLTPTLARIRDTARGLGQALAAALAVPAGICIMRNGGYTMEKSTWTTKAGLAQMLKGGVIMDVVTPEQARIAEAAGAVAVMALERVPADIRAQGGVARMSD